MAGLALYKSAVCCPSVVAGGEGNFNSTLPWARNDESQWHNLHTLILMSHSPHPKRRDSQGQRHQQWASTEVYKIIYIYTHSTLRIHPHHTPTQSPSHIHTHTHTTHHTPYTYTHNLPESRSQRSWHALSLTQQHPVRRYTVCLSQESQQRISPAVQTSVAQRPGRVGGEKCVLLKSWLVCWVP